MANSPPVAPFTSEALGETRVWGRQVGNHIQEAVLFQGSPVIPGCCALRFLEIHKQLRHAFAVKDRTGDAW